ncbi:MAG: hypothetical protein QNL12_15075, partial [Acidimicrobiia bacterium]|nr:hypothetical protein [Acidimicrobiia bacterium]
YEFYITKVLWAPPWGDLISMAHVDIVSFIVLALFWHPFMAFIFPLAVGEVVGTRGNWMTTRLPRLTRLSPRKTKLVLACAALTHGLLMVSLDTAIVSTLSAMLVVVAVSLWWRRRNRHRTWNLRELLPNDRQGKWLMVLLLLQYIVFIPTWTPDRMPPFVGHLIVWLLYAGFGLLLYAAGGSSEPDIDNSAEIATSRSQVLSGAGAVLGLSIIGAFGPMELGYVIVWIGAVIIGVRMLFGMTRKVLREPAPTSTR